MTNKNIIDDGFLLGNKYAEELYFTYAAPQPIIDYHNHLPPKDISEDRVYENISQAWMEGDHYKWRAMRSLGVEEKYITGNASDREKFKAWARVVPQTLRNPLFHWTHLELKRYFDINQLLHEGNADEVYDQVKEKLARPENSCRGLLTQMKVEYLCTTEDPLDRLEYHQSLAKSDFGIKVSTAFRPDKAFAIETENYNEYLDELSRASNILVNSFQDLCDALADRMDYFHRHGCRLCDHGISAFPYHDFSEAEITRIFQKRRQGEEVSGLEAVKFKTAVLLFLGESYHRLGWVQQFHVGALRNNNSRMLKKLGPDTGWDSIGDFPQAEKLSRFLDALDSRNSLPKTILYNLNPADNAVFASMVGNFNDGSIKGKVQYGSGWWYLDQKNGIEEQLNSLSNMGLISTFIGMLTDSRSFLSFPRHEYFRRVLCNLLGAEMASGELPREMEMIGKLVADISYHNAKEYFEL